MQPFGRPHVDFEGHAVTYCEEDAQRLRPALVNWLQPQLRVAWALLVAVVLLIDHAVRITRKRPSLYLTESGDFLLTESGDRFLLES
jgi:hypothetical protein